MKLKYDSKVLPDLEIVEECDSISTGSCNVVPVGNLLARRLSDACTI